MKDTTRAVLSRNARHRSWTDAEVRHLRRAVLDGRLTPTDIAAGPPKRAYTTVWRMLTGRTFRHVAGALVLPHDAERARLAHDPTANGDGSMTKYRSDGRAVLREGDPVRVHRGDAVIADHGARVVETIHDDGTATIATPDDGGRAQVPRARLSRARDLDVNGVDLGQLWRTITTLPWEAPDRFAGWLVVAHDDADAAPSGALALTIPRTMTVEVWRGPGSDPARTRAALIHEAGHVYRGVRGGHDELRRAFDLIVAYRLRWLTIGPAGSLAVDTDKPHSDTLRRGIARHFQREGVPI